MRTHRALPVVVGVAAMTAPTLHSITDVMEWHQAGFSTPQLWLNYAAFLPMPWLLLGLYAVRLPRPGVTALVGALLYGAAFTYFAYTTLYALGEQVPDYAALWQRLGWLYTFHGALMVVGGLLFGGAALHGGWLPRIATVLFLGGIAVNALLSMLPTPDILQTFGSAVRNLGLVIMGHAVLFKDEAGTR